MLIFIVSQQARDERRTDRVQRLKEKNTLRFFTPGFLKPTTRKEKLLLKLGVPKQRVLKDLHKRIIHKANELGKPDLIIVLSESAVYPVWEYIKTNPEIPAVYGWRAGEGMIRYVAEGKQLP